MAPSRTPIWEHFESRRLMSAGGVNVVLIDRSLPDANQLVQAANHSRVISFDQRDSAQSILDRVVRLARHENVQIKSLSLISHGRAGAFSLGKDWISSSNIGSNAAHWRRVRQVFGSDSQIHLYGCNVATSKAGLRLIDRISRLSGAATYASTDLTGAGGDWVLEAEASKSPRYSNPHAALD